MSGDLIERLKPCPFCAQSLFVRRGVNAYGRCETSGCWAEERKIMIPLDDPRQVAAWNTRAELSARPTDDVVERMAGALEWIEGATSESFIEDRARQALASLPGGSGEG